MKNVPDGEPGEQRFSIQHGVAIFYQKGSEVRALSVGESFRRWRWHRLCLVRVHRSRRGVARRELNNLRLQSASSPQLASRFLICLRWLLDFAHHFR